MAQKDYIAAQQAIEAIRLSFKSKRAGAGGYEKLRPSAQPRVKDELAAPINRDFTSSAEEPFTALRAGSEDTEIINTNSYAIEIKTEAAEMCECCGRAGSQGGLVKIDSGQHLCPDCLVELRQYSAAAG
jgi:hypothetical protein